MVVAGFRTLPLLFCIVHGLWTLGFWPNPGLSFRQCCDCIFRFLSGNKCILLKLRPVDNSAGAEAYFTCSLWFDCSNYNLGSLFICSGRITTWFSGYSVTIWSFIYIVWKRKELIDFSVTAFYFDCRVIGILKYLVLDSHAQVSLSSTFRNLCFIWVCFCCVFLWVYTCVYSLV